jgi:hypothetical protein
MTKRARKKPVRPISSRRDYEGASALAKRMAGETQRDSAAELRLQALLRELDKFDDTEEEDAGDDSAKDFDSSGPRRRWSDEGSSED